MPNRPDESRQNPPIMDVEDLSSATECTGLTPAAVDTPDEAASYTRLYAIHRQKVNTLSTGEDAGEVNE